MTDHRSAYADDTRVQWPTAEAPADVRAYLPDPASDAQSRTVMQLHDHVVVRGTTTDDATLYDSSDKYSVRLHLFNNVDEAIYAVIGEPWQAQLLDTAIGTVSVVPIYDRHLRTGQRFIGPDGGVYEVLADYSEGNHLDCRDLNIDPAQLNDEGYPACEGFYSYTEPVVMYLLVDPQ